MPGDAAAICPDSDASRCLPPVVAEPAGDDP